MNKILNNIIKGLLVAFLIVIGGELIYLNVTVSPNTSMILVSSSIANSIKTNKTKIENKKDIKEEFKEEIKEEEPVEEEKEAEVIKEETPVVVSEPKKEETIIESTKEPETSVPEPNGSYSPSQTDGEVSATYTGFVTAYGPDCYGCYGSMTAMGDYVGDGNIYYNHPTYGTIRIVAGDRSILNKVVRITGLNISSEPVIAIVRDTGGDIGFNKPKGIILDLLFTSEKSSEVLNFGMQKATVEVLN